MRVTADRERCLGSGMCVFLAPGSFDQDDQEGRVVVTAPQPESAQLVSVRNAVSACPVAALSLTEDGDDLLSQTASATISRVSLSVVLYAGGSDQHG